jgi:protein-glutamine gamma-glutamyltransferase
VKRYCEISCHAVVVTAFFALAMTGRLDMLAIGVFTPVFAISLYRAFRQLPPLLTARGAFYLSCIYPVVAFFDLGVFSGSLIGSAVHMVLFLELVKLHQEKFDRDYLYLIILAFLKILAASSLTVDVSFVGTLLLFVVALVAMLISLDIYRSERESRMTTREAALALSTVSVWTTLWIVLLGGALFFVIPRVGTGYFTRASIPQLLLTGFTDTVELGEIGELKQNSSIVMHARRITGTPYAVLKWRGIALDTFDGIRWSKDNKSRRTVRQENSNYIFRREPARGELVTYDILLEPIATTVLFGPYEVKQISGRLIPGTEIDNDGAVFTRFQQSQRLQYRVQSQIVNRLASRKDTATGNVALPEEVRAAYLQLPANLDPRVIALAQEITRDAETPLAKTVRIEDYLRRNYQYTLALTWDPGDDPLSTFLFRTRSGHCEYFASAMAVLLRASGVHTRVVNGFLMGEYNPVGDAYIIRQSDAHSWIEVYLPDSGWTEFDPTPAGGNQPGDGLLAQLHNYADAVGFFWNTYILTYDTDSQGQLFHNAQESVEKFQANLKSRREKLALGIQSYVNRFSQGIRSAFSGGGEWTFALSAFAVILIYLMRQDLRSRWWLYQLRRTGHVDGRIVTALFHRAVSLAQRKGPRRRDSQTWREWLGTVSHDQRRTVLQRALEVFERSKYGHQASSPADVAVMQEAVRELRSLLQ